MNIENFDKFIFKGSLALESYYDDTKKNKELFDSFNEKLAKYRLLNVKKETDKISIVNDLMSIINNIGEEKFIIYEDGDIEYKYNN